ncbi:T9SS type A sorting domain-containing protein [Seonamhaeicola maritimus]|uniref:T9SS type A sorting domain-containing protein n=1 Tax=Seonamhaeicola maritimus TaxID=2591822 RepID=A0A5C7GN21_9FLAO|nr:T9SS type A sorting domain-containing protein [Seonamhaeicola maritimus]TXG40114.1 T9SS type A sorting domain-containing protein [Seonamhaeicola maritimus]
MKKFYLLFGLLFITSLGYSQTYDNSAGYYISTMIATISGTDTPDEFIEFRGPAGTSFPTGTYLVTIEGDGESGNLGIVLEALDLSGLTFGTNGYLTVTFDPDTGVAGIGNSYETVLAASASNDYTQVDVTGYDGDLINYSGSYLLISALTNPIGLNVDSPADGEFDAVGAHTAWNIYDSVSSLDDDNGGEGSEFGYGQMIVANNYSTNPGIFKFPSTSSVLSLDDFGTSQSRVYYIGRQGESTGYDIDLDWMAGQTYSQSVRPNWEFNGVFSKVSPDALAKTTLPDSSFGGPNVDPVSDSSLVYIPDPNFEQALIAEKIDASGILNGIILKSEAEAVTGQLDVRESNISDLTGIEAFVNITELQVGENLLSTINISNNPKLLKIWAYGNQLTNIDFSNNTKIHRVSIGRNQLTELDVSMLPDVDTLLISTNQIKSIDLSNNPNLVRLSFGALQLKSLDLSKNTKLEHLVLGNNTELVHLDLRSGYNELIHTFSIHTTPNLTCIYADANYDPLVDTEIPAEISQAMVDEIAAQSKTLSEDCGTVFIPDENFETYLETHNAVGEEVTLGDPTSMGDGVLNNLTLKSKVETVTDLTVNSLNIASLTGIEAFKNITDLNCRSNPSLTSLNITKNGSLTKLDCRVTGISHLDVSNNGELTYLACGNANMTNIDVSKNTNLETLRLGNSDLSTIDVSNNIALTWLEVHGNNLTSIDITNNKNLTSLSASHNQLSNLDISNNGLLEFLYGNDNQLTGIDVTSNKSLERLQINNNQITDIDVSTNTALLSLNCADNNLNSLDVSINKDLTSLICSRNQISSLNVEKNTKLIHLAIFDIPITEINLINNKELRRFYANNNQFLSTIDFSQNSKLNLVTITNSVIKTLDLSNSPGLLFLRLYDNPQLAHFDIRNNNNTIVSRFDIWNTPNLTCINADANYDPLVDTEIPTEISQAMIDSGKIFSEDCGDFVEILDSNFTNISCNGANNGTINITVSNGLAPYVFEWTNSENPEFSSSNEDLAGLAPGTYQLLITDANGTTASLSGIIITEPVLLTATATGEALLCFGDSDGEINLTVSGGTAPYTYSWSNGSTVEDPSGLVVGDYTVVVTDANGCTTNLSASITEPELLVASITNISTICSNNATVTVAGGTLDYTYLWSNGATEASINNVPAGTYDVTVTDANGCTTIASIDLTVGEAFNPSASVTDVTCFGENNGVITVTNANGDAPFSFSIDGINFIDGEFPYSFNDLAADTYEIAVRDKNGCTGFISKTVSEPEELTATLLIVESTCFDQSTGAISVDASGGTGGLSYSWTGEGYTASQKNINGLAAGTYVLTVTDNNECTTTLEVEVPTFHEIVVEAKITDVLCRGELTGAIDLTVSGGSGSGSESGFTYSWTGNIISTSQDISNLGAGVNYNVTITDIGTGCTVSKSYVITEPETNLALATTKTNASGCGASAGTITASGSGGTPPYKYRLDEGAYQSSNMFSFLSGGTYMVWVRDFNGCTSSKEVIITDNGKDEYESNNSKKKAVEIGIGPTINGRIALANDVADWFKFDAFDAPENGNYTVALTHPSINFNLDLYPDGKNASAMVPVGNGEYELIGGATYYVEITSTEVSFICYDLIVSKVASVGKRGATKNQEIEINDLSVRAYPNPHKGSFNLSVKSPEEGMAQIQLFNVLGQLLSKREVFVVKGQETIVNFNDADRGMILYHIKLNGKNINGKLVGKD